MSLQNHRRSSRHRAQRAHPRLELALRLARQFGAHLTGVFAVLLARSSLALRDGRDRGYYGSTKRCARKRRARSNGCFMPNCAARECR